MRGFPVSTLLVLTVGCAGGSGSGVGERGRRPGIPLPTASAGGEAGTGTGDTGGLGEDGDEGATDGAGDEGQAADSGMSGGDGPRFDLGEVPDPPPPMVDCGEFSNIWIANSTQGTVSKIDTVTGVELGRFHTSPQAGNQPSRTAVNLYGDMVVVNRGGLGGGAGSIVKIAAREKDCVDKNGNGTIETSTGPTDILAWGTDECVLWDQSIASANYYQGPRPVGWEPVAVDKATCAPPGARVWVGHFDHPGRRGVFRRLQGDTGTLDAEVVVPNLAGQPIQTVAYGPYGGAVDANLDFWSIGLGNGPLIHIDGTTLTAEVIPTPSVSPQNWNYGMALDHRGHPWVASAGHALHYDPSTRQWQDIDVTSNTGSMRGVMVDREGRAWFAVNTGMNGPGGLAAVDTMTGQVLQLALPFSTLRMPVGVSIDRDGFVWVVDQLMNSAYKVNADTMTVDTTVGGLVSPYTYSDMTGAGLNLVFDPPR